jgi:hypothetical protein
MEDIIELKVVMLMKRVFQMLKMLEHKISFEGGIIAISVTFSGEVFPKIIFKDHIKIIKMFKNSVSEGS